MSTFPSTDRSKSLVLVTGFALTSVTNQTPELQAEVLTGLFHDEKVYLVGGRAH